jgi:ferredoxin
MINTALNECIDCAVCVPECPVDAIYADEGVPGDQQHFIALNADLACGWPLISKRKPALPEADFWASVRNKRAEVKR